MTRPEAEQKLWGVDPGGNRHQGTEATSPPVNPPGKNSKTQRRRIDATYCPSCGSWVEVRLQPIWLHCTGCGIEARP